MGIPYSVFHRVGRTCAGGVLLPAGLASSGQGALLGGQMRGIDLFTGGAFRGLD
jgi:hypothetical protein